MLLLALPYSRPSRQKQVNLLHLHGIVQIHGMPIRYSIVKELKTHSFEQPSIEPSVSSVRSQRLKPNSGLLYVRFVLQFLCAGPARCISAALTSIAPGAAGVNRPGHNTVVRPIGRETLETSSQDHERTQINIKWRNPRRYGMQRLAPTWFQRLHPRSLLERR